MSSDPVHAHADDGRARQGDCSLSGGWRLISAALMLGVLSACVVQPTAPERSTEPVRSSSGPAIEPATAVRPVADPPVVVSITRPAPEKTPVSAPTPTPAPAPAPAPTPRTEISLTPPPPNPTQNVYFAAGSDWIDTAGRLRLQEVAERLKGRTRIDITLIGHTDDAGSREFDIALAQKRVEAVAAELEAMGVSPRQIRRISYGSEAAGTSSCTQAACRQRERRVELRLSNRK